MQKRFLGRLCQFLISDLQSIDIFNMVEIYEYGKVRGYSDEYADVKKDLLTALQLYEDMSGLPAADAVRALPELVRQRPLNKALLSHERATLLHAMETVLNDLSAAQPAQIETQIARLPQVDQTRLNAMMTELGVFEDVTAVTNREKIYISSRASPPLQEQLIRIVGHLGMTPVLRTESATVLSEEGARQRMAFEIEACRGGVIGLIHDRTHQAADAEPANRLAETLFEIDAAERRFPDRFMLIAQHRAMDRLPRTLRGKPIFSLSSEVMDESEQMRFAAIISRQIWH